MHNIKLYLTRDTVFRKNSSSCFGSTCLHLSYFSVHDTNTDITKYMAKEESISAAEHTVTFLLTISELRYRSKAGIFRLHEDCVLYLTSMPMLPAITRLFQMIMFWGSVMNSTHFSTINAMLFTACSVHTQFRQNGHRPPIHYIINITDTGFKFKKITIYLRLTCIRGDYSHPAWTYRKLLARWLATETHTAKVGQRLKVSTSHYRVVCVGACACLEGEGAFQHEAWSDDGIVVKALSYRPEGHVFQTWDEWFFFFRFA